MPDVDLTPAELVAVLTWAGAAGIGFHEGPETPAELKAAKHDPSRTALAKLRTAARYAAQQNTQEVKHARI